MKKTVIKRRKRVPAAPGPGGSGRMSDQAAAETLVAVARLGVGAAVGGEESEGEGDQPKKKRARRSTKSEKDKTTRKDLGDEDVRMEGAEEDEERPPSKSIRTRSRESNRSGTWGDTMGDPRPSSRRGLGEAGSSSGAAPSLDHQQRSPRGLHNQEGLDGRYTPHHLQRGFGSPHPHGGFDLPPLNAALSGDNPAPAVARGYGYNAALMDAGRGEANHFAGAPSSYMRSAPSRTHSPLGPAGAGAGYVLPPPHSHSIGHSHQYYAGLGSQTSLSGVHSYSPPPSQPQQQPESVGLVAPGLLSLPGEVPSVQELEQHYNELREQRNKLHEMLDKTDRIISGLKRGIDEMRSGQQAMQTQTAISGAGAVRNGNSILGNERERSRESVWPVVEATSRE